MGHEHEEACGCGKESCGCQGGGCGCGGDGGCCQEEGGVESMPKRMMEMAEEAWAELMLDKMKAHYEKAMGPKMDKAAHIAVEACIALWEGKMAEKGKWAEYEEKLEKALNG